MNSWFGLLVSFAFLAVPLLYVIYLMRGKPAQLTGAVTPYARFRLVAADVRDAARMLHEAIRTSVLAGIGGESAHLHAQRTRILELCESGLVVSPGVATPPGPTRVLLEIRERGDKPGMRLVAFVRRQEKAKDRFEIELRGSGPRLLGVPARESRLVVDALTRALQADGRFENVEWSRGGGDS